MLPKSDLFQIKKQKNKNKLGKKIKKKRVLRGLQALPSEPLAEATPLPPKPRPEEKIAPLLRTTNQKLLKRKKKKEEGEEANPLRSI